MIVRLCSFWLALAFWFCLVGSALAIDNYTVETQIANAFEGGGVAKSWRGLYTTWTYDLPFAFPIFGQSYWRVYVSSSGMICFDSADACLYSYNLHRMTNGPVIYVANYWLRTDINPTDDIYINETGDRVVIRWQGTDAISGGTVNAEVELYANGNVKFNYGAFSSAFTYEATSGIAKGDGLKVIAGSLNGRKNYNQGASSFFGNFKEVATTPSNGITGVHPATDTIKISFAQVVFPGTGSVDIMKEPNDSLWESIPIESQRISGWNSTRLNIQLSRGLENNSAYYVLIGSQAVRINQDAFFVGFPTKNSWSFHTAPLNTTHFSFNESLETESLVDLDKTNASWEQTNSGRFKIPRYERVSEKEGRYPVYAVTQIDSQGRPMVTWADALNYPATDSIRFTRWNGEIWTKADLTTPGIDILPSPSSLFRIYIDHGNGVAITRDPSGNPIVAWSEWNLENGVSTGLNIALSRWNGSSWTKMDGVTPGSERVFTLPSMDYYATFSMASDMNGNPVIAYIHNNQYVEFVRWNGSAWTHADGITPGPEVIQDRGGIGGFPKILIHRNGEMTVIWYHTTGGPMKEDIFLTHWNGSAWKYMDGVTPGVEQVSNTAGTSWGPNGVLDLNDRVLTYWDDNTPGQFDIFAQYWTGASWTHVDGTTPGLENISNTPSRHSWIDSLLFNSLNQPIAIWQETPITTGDSFLCLSRWNGSVWTHMDGITSGCETIGTPNNLGGVQHLMRVAGESRAPRIAFSSDAKTLEYQEWSGSQWLGMDRVSVGSDSIAQFNDLKLHSLDFNSATDPFLTFWAREEVGDQYKVYLAWNIPRSTVISHKVTDVGKIIKATLSSEQATPGLSSISYFLSNDGGQTWHGVERNTPFSFPFSGNDLRWKAVLNKGSVPILDGVSLDYEIARPTPPVVTSPVHNSHSNNSKPTIAGTGDNSNRVALYANGILLDTIAIDSEGNWSYTATSPWADGPYLLTALSIDNYGNLSEVSNEVLLNIKTSLTIQPVLLDSNWMLPLTDDTRPFFSGRAEPGSTITIAINGAIVSEITVGESGNWSWISTENLGYGEFHITIEYFDLSGNKSQVASIETKVIDDLDGDGLTTEEELSIGTEPHNSDTDDDSVSDGKEITDGTNPLDRGSALLTRERTLCAEWNGFLSMWNVLEHVNTGSSKISITTDLNNIFGSVAGRVSFDLRPHYQFDLLVHDMEGKEEDLYGLVCSTATKGLPGDLDGRMVLYKPGSNGVGFDFAYAMSLNHGLRGKQYVHYNTFQPSFAPEDASNLVANWIQVTNLEATLETGLLKFYDQKGNIVASQTVRLGPGGRFDFSAHDRAGPKKVGLVEWLPTKQDANFQLRNVRYYYTSGMSSFDSALQLEGFIPSGELLTLPVSNIDRSTVIEISNAQDSAVIASISLYAKSGGTPLETRAVQIASHSTYHLITDPILKGVEGIATIKANKRESLIASSLHYSYDSAGSIKNIYAIQATESVGDTLQGTYNTFLDQKCELLLANSSPQNCTVSLSMKRYDGVDVVLNKNLSVPAQGLNNLNLCELDKSNSYGVVVIKPDISNAITATVVRIGKDEQYRFATQVRH